MTDRTRVLFVNSGILGQGTFSKFVREAMTVEPGIDAWHMNLSEDLTVGERVLRRALCGRLWRDGWLGVRNLDFNGIAPNFTPASRPRAGCAVCSEMACRMFCTFTGRRRPMPALD